MKAESADQFEKLPTVSFEFYENFVKKFWSYKAEDETVPVSDKMHLLMLWFGRTLPTVAGRRVDQLYQQNVIDGGSVFERFENSTSLLFDRRKCLTRQFRNFDS